VPMKGARKKPAAANLRSWRVIIVRSRGEYLSSVEVPDRESAQAIAIKQFASDQDQRSRLLIRESHQEKPGRQENPDAFCSPHRGARCCRHQLGHCRTIRIGLFGSRNSAGGSRL